MLRACLLGMYNVIRRMRTMLQVWKKGVLMRVDGSLMGIDDKANTLIPQWKRGHFSLLFDGRPTPASLLLVDHRKQTVVDLTKERRIKRPEIDDEVSRLLLPYPLRCIPPDIALEQGGRL